jgi:hypothetical protein
VPSSQCARSDSRRQWLQLLRMEDTSPVVVHRVGNLGTANEVGDEGRPRYDLSSRRWRGRSGGGVGARPRQCKRKPDKACAREALNQNTSEWRHCRRRQSASRRVSASSPSDRGLGHLPHGHRGCWRGLWAQGASPSIAAATRPRALVAGSRKAKGRNALSVQYLSEEAIKGGRLEPSAIRFSSNAFTVFVRRRPHRHPPLTQVRYSDASTTK